jgi:hypothetical protein
VADIMNEITAASQEQSSGIQEVSQAITQMDEMTQQNATLVEQAAAAAESMQTQASTLVQAVSVFKLDNALQTTMLSAPQAHGAVASSKSLAVNRSARTKVPAARTAQLPVVKSKLPVPAGNGHEWEEF